MHRFWILFLCPVLFSFSQINLPEPYRSIELLAPDNHGWYHNSAQVAELIRIREPKTVIEVGSWLGNSTIHIASLLPSDGKVYAIDHWQGSSEHQTGNWAWYKALPYLYQQFLSNVIHAGMAEKVVPLRMPSLQAAGEIKAMNLQVDLIYIDASHETELVYADLKAWFPFVKGHGILSGDDWGWHTVAAAVKRFAKENRLNIHATDNFWFLTER